MRVRLTGQALLMLLVLLLAGCKSELYASLPEREANEMLAILLGSGISAEKTTVKDGSITLAVEKSEFAQAVSLLSERGYPRRRFETMGDVFKASGLVASPMQERARFLWALSQELSATVAEIDGVLSARVEVVLPNNDLLARNPAPSSASVFVRYDDRSAVATLVPQIKMLVANSVEGLTYDKVSVVLVPAAAPLPSPNSAIIAPAGPVTFVLAGGGALFALLGGAGWLARKRLAALFRAASLAMPAQATLANRSGTHPVDANPAYANPAYASPAE